MSAPEQAEIWDLGKVLTRTFVPSASFHCTKQDFVATASLGQPDGSLPQNTPHHIPSCGVTAAPLPQPKGFRCQQWGRNPHAGQPSQQCHQPLPDRTGAHMASSDTGHWHAATSSSIWGSHPLTQGSS